MKIIHVPASEINTLAELVASLTAQGLAFIVNLNGENWNIEITGF